MSVQFDRSMKDTTWDKMFLSFKSQQGNEANVTLNRNSVPEHLFRVHVEHIDLPFVPSELKSVSFSFNSTNTSTEPHFQIEYMDVCPIYMEGILDRIMNNIFFTNPLVKGYTPVRPNVWYTFDRNYDLSWSELGQ